MPASPKNVGGPFRIGDKVRVESQKQSENRWIEGWRGQVIAIHANYHQVLYAVWFHDDIKPVWFHPFELSSLIDTRTKDDAHPC